MQLIQGRPLQGRLVLVDEVTGKIEYQTSHSGLQGKLNLKLPTLLMSLVIICCQMSLRCYAPAFLSRYVLCQCQCQEFTYIDLQSMWIYTDALDLISWASCRTQPPNDAGMLSPTTSNGADRSTANREHTSSSRTSDLAAAPVTGKNPNRSQIPEMIASKAGKKVDRVRAGDISEGMNTCFIYSTWHL